MKKRNWKTFIVFLFTAVPMIWGQEKKISLEFPESLKQESYEITHERDELYHYQSSSKLIYSIKETKTFFNKRGNSGSILVIPYNKSIKVKNLNLYVYDSKGELHRKFKAKDFYDVSSSDGLIDDSRYLIMDYEPLAYPFTIKYSYELDMGNTGFVRQWMPLKSFASSVKEAKVTICVAPELKLNLVEELYGFESIKVHESSNSNNEIVYQMQNQKAFDYEPYAPERVSFLPHVKFSIENFYLEGVQGTATSWNAFGKWYYNTLIQDRVSLSEIEKARVSDLVAGVDDPLEKTKLIYEYMQGRTRYISVQLGIGGWQPEKASVVSSLGYGDCKGLTNYTHALLKEVGVDSFHTIIYGGSQRERRDIDQRIVGLQGNHMILYVPINGEDYWLECTSQTVPFGHLGDFTGDRDVVVVRPEGGEIKRTRIYERSENQKKLKSQIKIDQKGGFTADISINSSGLLYDRMQSIFTNRKPSDIELIYKRAYDRILKLSIDDMDFVDHKPALRFEESIAISSPQFAKKMGNMFMFSAIPFEGQGSFPRSEQIRELDFEVFYESEEDYSYAFELPSGYVLEALPENVFLESPFGMYSLELKQEEGKIIVSRRYTRVKGRFKADQYDEFRSFRKKVNKFDNSKILIKKEV